jgi:hypothetical protein
MSGGASTKGQDCDTSCNWEPLHMLSKLEHLDAELWPGEPKDTGKLSKLSSLSSLCRVELTYRDSTIGEAGGDGAAAWQKLPVKVLHFVASEYGRALVQQLGKLQGLQELRLRGGVQDGVVKATLEQLGAALQSLTDLRLLRIQGLSSIAGAKAQEGSEKAYHDVEGVAAVLQAIGGMQKLVVLHVELPVKLTEAAVQQVTGMMGQLLPSWMAPYCQLQGDKLSIVL